MIRKSQFSIAAKGWFKDGRNVIAEAQASVGQGISAQDAIEMAYDLQAGSYVEAVSAPERQVQQIAWGRRVAGILDELGVRSACEAGVGEATTLAHIANAAGPGTVFSGFDVALSRILYGRDYLRAKGAEARLFCADLLQIPLAAGAVDAVITNHSLEPNGGQEGVMLAELVRVAARYLVLIEPDFDLAGAEQRERMTRHNYIRGLPGHLKSFPGRILRHEAWPFCPNPLNKASLIVFEKRHHAPARATFDFVAPVTKLPLTMAGGFLFCAAEGLLYPMPFGVPVLRDECAIICTHADRFGRGDGA